MNLRVQRGHIHALIGPNGAGKTTCFNLLTKFLVPSSGQILFNNRDITAVKPAHIARQGIIRSFQISAVFPHLTVLENVRLAVQSRAGIGMSMLSLWFGHREVIQRAEHYLERVSMIGKRGALVGTLSHGDQRKLEVAILLALEPAILMFDEPTAGMSVDEVPVVLDLIHQVKAERDNTVLLVEHKMDVVRQLADRIVVLHNGTLVADGQPAEVMQSKIVQEAYLGTPEPA